MSLVIYDLDSSAGREGLLQELRYMRARYERLKADRMRAEREWLYWSRLWRKTGKNTDERIACFRQMASCRKERLEIQERMLELELGTARYALGVPVKEEDLG